MNLAYLIWLEGLENPIIVGQVIELLTELRRHLKKGELHLIAFQPIYRFLLRRFAQNRANLKQIRVELKQNGIDLSLVPVLYPGWWFFAKWYQIPLVFIQAFPVLLHCSAVRKAKLFHCRSYPITLAAIAVKKLRNTKVIFDPRSDFPEENVTSGRWKESSLSYKVWKFLEKTYLNNADVTIAIANTYVEHFKAISSKPNLVVIPNNVDVGKFKRDENFRRQFRAENDVKDDELLFCYCGALGGWHKAELYAKYMIKFRGLDTKHRFLFITHQVDILEKTLTGYGISSTEYFAIRASFSEVPKYLSAADLGMTLLDRPKIAMAVKTPEYLSVGLPVITNSNAAGAKEVVERNGVGLVFDLDSDLERLEQFIQGFMHQRQELVAQCREVASRVFSNESVANQYAKLYIDTLA